jgi:hypothetical protein
VFPNAATSCRARALDASTVDFPATDLNSSIDWLHMRQDSTSLVVQVRAVRTMHLRLPPYVLRQMMDDVIATAQGEVREE